MRHITFKNIYRGYTFIFLILILTSCRLHDESNYEKSFLVSNEGEIYNTDYFFSQPKVIILETIPESLIAEISKIYIKNNYLYILDKKSQKVLIFNDQGKFVRSIKNRGNGPGEYIQLIDFSLDNKGRLVLYSDIPGKIIFYSNTGDFLYEKKLKDTYLSMSIVDELIYFQNLPTKKYTVTMLDLSNDKKIKLLKSFPEYNNVFLKGYSISSNTNIILTRRFDPLVYSISNDSVKILYKIDFGKSFITKDFLSKYAKSKDFFKKCFDNNFVFTYINTQLIKNKLVFNTNHALMHIILTQENKVYSINQLKDNFLGIKIYSSQRILIDGESEYLGFLLNPELLLHYTIENRTANNDFYEELCKLNDNSNPVLILYKFKQ